MSQLKENARVTTTFLAISAVLAWAVTITGANFLSPINLWHGLKYLSTATGVAGVAYFILNRYLWRLRWINALLKIPDFSGRWEGWTYRNLSGEWRPSAQEISQSALDIVADAWGPDNWAQSICASVVQDSHGTIFQLVWSYRTQSTSPNVRQGDTHQGTHLLRLSERDGCKYLEGIYITDRVRDDQTIGAGGFIRLVHVSSTLKRGLAFDEGKWGLARPTEGIRVLPSETDRP